MLGSLCNGNDFSFFVVFSTFFPLLFKWWVWLYLFVGKVKNDIANQQLHSNVALCGKCKLYPQINTAKRITNGELNVMKKIKCTGNFKERKIIYTAQIYWRYRGKPFRAFLQTSLLHQKQARQHRTCQSQHKR